MAPADPFITVQGVQIPRLGFGTWQMTGRDCVEGVRDALAMGYRHIDTARAYGNEREVGKALRDSGLPREEIFVTTKIWMDDLGYDALRRAAEDSLRQLDLTQIDLLLIHWPNPGIPLEESLRALTELRDEGSIRLLGVSNFPPRLLRRALELAPVAADQVEFHPFLGQDALLAIAAEHDLTITAYAPLAHGKVPRNAALARIGERHGKTAGQVALRWLLEQPGTTVIPKASSTARRLENFEIHDFELTDADHEDIAALPKDQREFDPGWAPDWEA